MRGGFRIGRLFGIDVGVDWSWGLVFLLMSWNLSVVFQAWHPTWRAGACVVLAVVAAMLFFASIVAHEFAHALVAKSYGMTVREIRLFLFGGVSDIEREPPSPRAEFWMAIAGPLASFGLGALFLFAAALMLVGVDPSSPVETLAGLGPLPTLLFWLGPVNIVVGAFNLIPGFPLDGGRILRAILWRLTGDLHKATLVASTVGRAIGWTFVLLGIAMVFGAKIPFFGQGTRSGVWLAFIGWFLASAAERSFGALVLHEILDGVRVAHLVKWSGSKVLGTTTVRDLVDQWFMRSNEHAIPVVHGDRLVGLVCTGDLRKVAPDGWDHATVADIMTPRDRLAVVAPADEAQVALRELSAHDVEQLPVLDGEVFVGLVSRRDISRWLELHARRGPSLGAPRPV